MSIKQQSVEAVIKKEHCRLNEGRNADKAKEKTLEVIRNFFNNAKWLDDEFVDAAANPNHLSVIDYIENRLKELCFHANIPDSVIRLEPIIMNIALSLGFEQTNPDSAKLNRLFRIVNCLPDLLRKGMLPQGFQLNQLKLDNTTYDRLNELFGSILDKQDAEEEERINSADYSKGINPYYKILSDIDYETAKSYGDYSCSDSKLCYTQNKSTWDKYTQGGSNTVYLLLHKDWKDIAEEHSKDTPYDDYGLSMIFVFIDEEGNIAYSNTRWNHKNDGQGPKNVDQSFTKEMLSKLLNVNFGEVFKPLHTFAEKVAKAKQQLQNGVDPKDVFDKVTAFRNGFAKVGLGGRYNFIDTDNTILNEDLWFDGVDDFNEGFATVYVNGRGANFIKPDGNILRDDLWFDDAWNFHEGFAKVRLESKWNFIKPDGNILREDLWFDEASSFRNGLAKVILGKKFNFIKPDGNILREDLWFDDEGYFYEGFAWVRIKGKGYNFIKPDGNFLRDDLWFKYAADFSEGSAAVRIKDKGCNFIKPDGNFLRDDIWFNNVYDFSEGFARVNLEGRGYNFIKPDGNLLREDLWFDFADDFSEGFAKVRLGNKYNFIKPDGNFLRDDIWFNNVYDFSEGFARVNLEGRGWNFINANGELISGMWFDEAWKFSKGFARVKLNDCGWTFIKPDCNFLRDDLWFDYAYEFREGFASVELDGKRCYLDTKGNLYDEDYNLINKVNENR